MIEKDNKLIEQLNNIIYQTNVIKNDLETNGKTHYRYMLEKLEKAKWDLDNIVEYLKEYANGGLNE